ncbi:MAG: cupin domain-containing protein [Sedimentisphaerales bacterium]|nr:cupin domain-containing protein [Sedimentisphaerales bacterium]
MTTEKKRAGTLEVCVSKAQNLIELVEYSQDSIVSKTILDKSVGTITLFAFDKGQKLSEHTTPYDAVVQVLDGNCQLTIDNQPKQVTAGEIIIMPGSVPHSVTATEKFKMLLIMIRA